MIMTPKDLLRTWLAVRLPPDTHLWLGDTLGGLSQAPPRQAQVTMALIARKLGNARLDLSTEGLAAAHAARQGWRPLEWTQADAGRVLVLLHLERDAESFGDLFVHLCREADHGELVSLYRGLPLYPPSTALDWQIGEGLRTAMQPVFEAIAHHSPLPAERFDEHRWNHMVLKALFIGSTLPPIEGLTPRRNATLAAILSDHVDERWAAGRPVDPHVWHCMAPFPDTVSDADLDRLANSADAAERRAAALLLLERPLPTPAHLDTILAAELALARAEISGGKGKPSNRKS